MLVVFIIKHLIKWLLIFEENLLLLQQGNTFLTQPVLAV